MVMRGREVRGRLRPARRAVTEVVTAPAVVLRREPLNRSSAGDGDRVVPMGAALDQVGVHGSDPAP